MISRLRLEPDGKKLRVIVDAEDMIARMKDVAGLRHGQPRDRLNGQKLQLFYYPRNTAMDSQ